MARNIVILGGSNSVLRNGWVNCLEKVLPGGFSIENRAIWGTTSLMGIYRFLTGPKLNHGDVLVWEYGVNEYGASRSLSVDALLDDVARLVSLCRDRGLCFLPVIMQHQAQHFDRADVYSVRLRQLFDECGIEMIDCREFLGREPYSSMSLDEIYAEPAHYRTDIGLTEAIAQEVADRLERMDVLRTAPGRPVQGYRDRSLAVFSDFDGGVTLSLRNSLVALDYTSFLQDFVGRFRGEVLGAIIVATPSAPGFSMHVDGRKTGVFSTQFEVWRREVALAQVSFSSYFFPNPLKVNDGVEFRRESRLDVDRIVQPQLKWDPQAARTDSADGLVALIVETPL